MLPVAGRLSLVLCIAFGFRPCVSANESSSAQIVGRWRSLETSKGGIGAMYEFHSDGTVDFSPGAVVEMPWRVESNQIVFPPAKIGGNELKLSVKWLGDNKIQFERAGNSSGGELTRIGNRTDASKPIIGEWVGEMPGRKLPAHWFFYPAGKGLFLVPFVTQHGRYTIADSTLHIEMTSAKPTDFRFELKDNFLILSKPESGGESRFARY